MSTDEDTGRVATGQRLRGLRRLIAVVAAVAVAAAVGTYLGVRLTAAAGPPTAGLPGLWTQRSGACTTSEALPWTGDGLAVTCAGVGMVAAYRLGTGRVAWKWHAPSGSRYLPESRDLIAQMSANTDDGIGVVGLDTIDSTQQQPNVYVGIDIASGRELWQQPVSMSGLVAIPAIMEGDGRFAIVAGTGNSDALQVYDLATGAPVWSSRSLQIAPAGCSVSGDAISGPWIYVVTSCSNGADQLYQMSLQTGSVTAGAPLQDAPCKAQNGTPSLWAIGGYVLAGCESGATTPVPELIIIGAGGMLQHTLKWTGSNGYYDFLNPVGTNSSLSYFLAGFGADTSPGIAISGSTLYIGGFAYLDSSGQEAEQLAAIDLSTDRLRWVKSIAIAGEPSHSVTHPVNVIGASTRGAFDVIENEHSNTFGVTLALVSADGTISYGPGTTLGEGPTGKLEYALDGDTFLVFGSSGCPVDCNSGAVTAYSTRSWLG